MREKKLLFLLSLIFLLLFAGTVFAADGVNWGTLSQTGTDIVPVFASGDYYSIGTQKNLEFTVSGDYEEFFYGSPTVDSPDNFEAMIIRTTVSSSDLEGIAWYDGTEGIRFEFVKDEVSGDFDFGSILSGIRLEDGESCDVDFSWDFTSEEKRYMNGKLRARYYEDSTNSLGGDTASCDVGLVLLGDSNNPVFDILAGDSSNMEHARAFGPVDTLSQNIDLGLMFLEKGGEINVVFANFWNQNVAYDITGLSEFLYEGKTYFAPDLYGGEEPVEVAVAYKNNIAPALAQEISIIDLENSPLTIPFTSGEETRFSWLWCETIFEDGPNAAGFAGGRGGPTEADFNDELDENVDDVLTPDLFFDGPGDISSKDFEFLTEPVSFDYMGQISMDITVPETDDRVKWAVPLGLRIGIPGENIEQYDPELMQAIDEELGENPTDDEIEALVRKYLSFTKEWDTGESFEIQLDDPEFSDAVDIDFEREGNDVKNIIFSLSLLVVNGGEAGTVDSATALDRKFIVIYDGVLDLHIADPIKLVAASDEDSSTGSGNGGCSTAAFVPAAALLLLPLLMLLKK